MKISDISDLTKEDVLASLGLAFKPSLSQRTLGALGTFGLGALVGAGVALLLAPRTGQELRGDLGRRIRRRAQEINASAGNGSVDRGSPEPRAST